MMHCWNCGKPYEIPLYGKLSFRASCEHCLVDLHCCKNCKYYKVGQPNDCLVPGTDFISDREKYNFCEEFSCLGLAPTENKSDKKKNFDDLFK